MISTTRFTAADLANLDVVKRWLRTGFLNREQRQTTLLASYLNLGDWLIVAYDLFPTEKLYGRVVGQTGQRQAKWAFMNGRTGKLGK